jgi:hypothetical protein
VCDDICGCVFITAGPITVCVYYCRTYYSAVRVFITAGPITKLFAGGGGGECVLF